MSVVVLASPHSLYRAGVASLLRDAGFTVVEADDIASALSALVRHTAAACVLDIDLDGGPDAVARLAGELPNVPVVVLASQATNDDILGSIRNGSAGYVPKTADGDGLTRAVRAVLTGQLAIPRYAVTALVGELQGRRRALVVEGRQVVLTSREARTLELLAEGLTTQEIADRLGVSSVTVRRHLGSVASKTGSSGIASLRQLVAS